ncbi:MAG: hypothetical protein IKW45_05350 [Clostridia bacterium]|nr:hypothetical protein [Clostridia bacterium]
MFEEFEIGHCYDGYRDDDDAEYCEWLDEKTKEYAKEYAQKHEFSFINYLAYSGYTTEEFKGWTEKEQQSAFEDFLHEAEDREKYIREREGLD